MTDRTPRTTETREKTVRKKGWSRPSSLPTPEPRDGLHFRWIRTATLGNSDNTNVSARFREGYTPVKASDVPELTVVSDIDSRFKDNVEVGGLLLCSIPAEIAEERVEVQLEQAQHAQDAVDRNFMRENDPRMPVLNPERSTRTSFGK
jgi:hypothetical protein|tara:strand:- start:719 stop:1162 length:444 start_codon:yes stop_codon:yes gene_type:complete